MGVPVKQHRRASRRASSPNLFLRLDEEAKDIPDWRRVLLDQRAATEGIREWASKLGRVAATESMHRFKLAGQKATGPIDVVDLFCGCGGLSSGFEMIGRATPSYRLAAAIDIDAWGRETYAANLPIRPLDFDLSLVNESEKALEDLISLFPLRQKAPLVLVGGPPCQGFSAHRKKDGKPQDDRNSLVRAFGVVASRLQPDLIVMENVPEVLSKKHVDQFLTLKKVLEASGYTIRAQVHNLASFGVPQERFRALILASKRRISMPEGFLPSESFKTVRDAIGKLPPVAPGESNEIDPMHVCTGHRKSTIDTIKQVPANGGRRPAGVGPACLDRVDGFRDVYGRMYWERPANTITAYARNPASGRYVHPEQHRGLTIREAALLQGFPREFQFEGPFDHKYLQIGNAVPPAFAAYLAAHVLGELLAEETDEVVPPEPNAMNPMSDSFSSGIAGRKKGRNRACKVELL